MPDLSHPFLNAHLPPIMRNTRINSIAPANATRIDMQVDPRHRVTDIEEVECNPASQHTTNHADDDVTNYTVTSTPS